MATGVDASSWLEWRRRLATNPEVFTQAKLWAEIIASVFATSASLLSFVSIYMHLKYNKHPIIRKYIIRILLMVPIYSLEAWLGLHFLEIGVSGDPNARALGWICAICR